MEWRETCGVWDWMWRILGIEKMGKSDPRSLFLSKTPCFRELPWQKDLQTSVLLLCWNLVIKPILWLKYGATFTFLRHGWSTSTTTTCHTGWSTLIYPFYRPRIYGNGFYQNKRRRSGRRGIKKKEEEVEEATGGFQASETLMLQVAWPYQICVPNFFFYMSSRIKRIWRRKEKVGWGHRNMRGEKDTQIIIDEYYLTKHICIPSLATIHSMV